MLSDIKAIKVVEVIKSEIRIGDGTRKNPVRIVIQYWDLKGNLLVTIDPYLDATRLSASSDIKS